MEPTVLHQVALVALGAALGLPGGWFAHRQTTKREREARHEGHLWGRREEFESLLAEFRPVYEKWRRLQGPLVRMQFKRMSDMDPQPDEGEVEALADEVRKYISQLRDRSPSNALKDAVARVAEEQDSLEKALILNNHVLLVGNDENQDEAFYEFFDKFDAFDQAVRDLSEATFDDGRPKGRSGYGSSPAQGDGWGTA